MLNKRLFTVFTFFISFTIYLLTNAPSIAYTDSGELAGVCSSLGVAHPSGYPLFTLIGYLWTKLPLPFTIIKSLNIMAAFFTATSTAIFFNLNYLFIHNIIRSKNSKKKENVYARKDKKNNKNTSANENSNQLINTEFNSTKATFISFFSALTFAFASIIWQQSNSIEVYSLHLTMISLVLYLALKALNHPKYNKYYLFAGLALGLSFANHLTTILLIPVLLIALFYRDNSELDLSQTNWVFASKILSLVFLGLSLYLFMVIRSASDPLFNWGDVHRNWDKFIYHAAGKQYQVWMFTGSAAWSANFDKFMSAYPNQLSWFGAFFVLFGFYSLFKSSKYYFTFATILIVTCIAYSFNYSIHDIESYFALAFLSLILVLSYGVYVLSEYKKELYFAGAIFPILLLVQNYKECDRSKDLAVVEYTHNMVDNLEKNAIVISAQWDYFCSAFWYLQKIENYRPDVIMIEKEILRRTWYPTKIQKWYPLIAKNHEQEINLYMEQLELFESGQQYDQILIQQRFVELLNSFIDKNIDTHPIYITLDVFDTEPELAKKYNKVPVGFAVKITKSNDYIATNMSKIKSDKIEYVAKNMNGHLDKGISEVSSMNLANIGRYALASKDTITAKNALEKAVRLNSENQLAIDALNALSRK